MSAPAGVPSCFNCGADLGAVTQPYGRRSDCPECRAELHCCRMCRHFDVRAPEQCREDRAEPPSNRETANFCEWFTLDGRRAPVGPGHAGGAGEQDARARLDALFGDADPASAAEPEGRAGSGNPAEDSEDAARRRLDDLFD